MTLTKDFWCDCEHLFLCLSNIQMVFTVLRLILPEWPSQKIFLLKLWTPFWPFKYLDGCSPVRLKMQCIYVSDDLRWGFAGGILYRNSPGTAHQMYLFSHPLALLAMFNHCGMLALIVSAAVCRLRGFCRLVDTICYSNTDTYDASLLSTRLWGAGVDPLHLCSRPPWLWRP